MIPYDLLVIGGGSAGFNAARLGHRLGKRVAIADGAKQLGGLCILQGCMPSKALLYMAEVLHLAQKGKTFGLTIPHASADMKAMAARKRHLVADFANHREAQLMGGNYDLYRSQARFFDEHTVELDDGRKLAADKIIISTGSRVSVPPIPGLAETPFWTSDDVLDLDFIPESVIVLGGGIVACELSQFLQRIGTRVVLIQRGPNLLSDHSPHASGVVQQALRDEGIEIFTATRIEQIASDGNGVTVRFESAHKFITKSARHLFNALGRAPNTEGLGLETIGVHTGPGGHITINHFQQTNIPHIYAGGDVSGPFDVVHLAIAQGEIAAGHAFGRTVSPVDLGLTLNVVFTDPQIGTIGWLEGALRERDEPFLAASYPFNDHGKSMLMDANHGYVKVIADPKGGKILGAEIVGKDAGELVHCFSGPIAMKATVFDLLRAPWYHPTLAEIISYPLDELAEQIQKV